MFFLVCFCFAINKIHAQSWSQVDADEYQTNRAGFRLTHNSWLTANISLAPAGGWVIDSVNGLLVGHDFDHNHEELFIVQLTNGNYIRFQSSIPMGSLISSKVVDQEGYVYFFTKSQNQSISLNKFQARDLSLQQVSLTIESSNAEISSLLFSQSTKQLIFSTNTNLYILNTINMQIVFSKKISVGSNLLLRQDNGFMYFTSDNTFIEFDIRSRSILNSYYWTTSAISLFSKIAYMDNGWFSIIYNSNLLSFFSPDKKVGTDSISLAGQFEGCSGIGYSTSNTQVYFTSYCYELGQTSPFSVYKLNIPSNGNLFLSKQFDIQSTNFQSNIA